jgi:hypothetical protein
MTLVETMVAVAIGSLVLGVVGVLAFYSGRSFASMGNYVELDIASRRTLDQMIREIRGTARLTGFQTNSLTFTDFDGTSLAYTYDPAERTLTRVKRAVFTVLLTNCVSLQFSIYQRFPNTNGEFFPIMNPADCKLVELTWKCVRTNYASTALNSESAQTARIVIRNKR